MTDAELAFAIAYQHYKCLGALHSKHCLVRGWGK